MSLYSALSAGVAGLAAEASAMAAVADNISNINTVGYKNTDSQFATMVGEGRAGATYAAGGVQAVPHSLISKQGVLQASSSATDIGIEGQGFFVTRTGTTKDSAVTLTRAGSFAADETGYLKNSAGLYLQGWRLDATGGYTNTGSVESLEPIRLSDLSGTASATTSIQLKINLQSTTDVNAKAGTYTAGDLASNTVTSDFNASVDVYDAQGGTHRLALGFIKTAANEWKGEIYATPASDVTATGGLLASGKIAFNPDGSLNKDGSDASFFNALTPTWTNKAASQPIKLALGDNGGVNGLTQFGSSFSKGSPTIDGGPLGSVASISISDKGVVSAVFADGKTKPVFQLPVATVPNPDGLTRISGNGFAVSQKSGSFAINAPGSAGAGDIRGGKLESSTADLAQEFTNMIRFQRAYSAASKVITTVDDMLQEVSNLKR